MNTGERVNLEARRAQMFPVLTPVQLARIAKVGAERSFADGAIVFEQGDVGTPFFVVLEGELEIVHPEKTGEERITIHRAREFTGEVSSLANRRTLVRGRARGLLRVLEVDRTHLLALIRNDSELSDIVMRAYMLRRVGLVSAGQGDVVVIGSRDSAATLRVQAFLVRNAHPYRYVDVERDPDVQVLLDQFHVGVADVPVLICRGERVLRNPSDAEVTECLGFNATLEPSVVHDVVVCGAGLGGLAAAVYGASEGLDVIVVEASSPGGQAASSSKIENYLGFPTGVSGQVLGVQALAQAEKFGARLLVARGAVGMQCADTAVRIDLDSGECLLARTVVIATGAEYRKLSVPDVAKFEGRGIFYAATFIESQRCADDEVVIVGGGNSAGQAATFLARSSSHVHLLIRAADLASSMSRYLIQRIEETANITLHRRTQIVALEGGEHLERVRWRDDATGKETTKPIRFVFTMAGAKPNTEWLRDSVATDANGFILTGADLTPEILEGKHWRLSRAPYLFETSHPHIFAVGDVRANSVKRVASAVGEGSVSIQLVHRALAE